MSQRVVGGVDTPLVGMIVAHSMRLAHAWLPGNPKFMLESADKLIEYIQH